MVQAHAIVTLLAAEVPAHKTLWNPTILGILVVIAAVGLFCGSCYLLLATNLGARLGVLVAVAGLSGFLVLLNLLWLTSATPVDPPHGRSAKWDVLEVVPELGASKIPTVRDIEQSGTQVTPEVLANLRPAIDAALVKAQPVGETELPEQPFAEFPASTAFLVDFEGVQSFSEGGGTKNAFWHHPRYAAVEICETRVVEVLASQKPPAPTCDPLGKREYVILRYDYGSLRLTVVSYLIFAAVIFGLSLLGLHWYELDQRERKRQEADLPGNRPVPVPSG